MPKQEFVVIGKVTGAHGIRGEVKATLFVDDTDFVTALERLYLEGRQRRELGVERLRLQKGNRAIIQFEGVEDRNGAERLRGRSFSIPADWLPELDEDEFYVTEIVGLMVETTEGEKLGKVDQVLFTGANEVYVVRGGPRGEILLPAISSVVREIDPQAGRLVVTLPEGLVD